MVLVTACGIFVAACMRDLVPGPGIEPGLPALGERSLYPLDHQGSPGNFLSKTKNGVLLIDSSFQELYLCNRECCLIAFYPQ